MDNIHQNHRKRVRDRFLNNGLEDFAPHEVLELILTYSIPRQDVNPIAHKLIERFGSVSAVMDADIYDLMTVPGVQETTATLLKLVPEAGKRYQIDKFTPTVVFDDIETVAEYCVYSHLRDTDEEISVMMLDARMRLLGNEILAVGSSCNVEIDLEKLGAILFRYNAKSFIIVHSHPGGQADPSDADVLLTHKIFGIMNYFNKTLLEHIIIADGHYVPIMHQLRSRGYDFYNRCSTEINSTFRI